MSWIHGAAARLRLLVGWRAAESRDAREIRFHIEMETERLVRESGLPPEEARRRALVAFGGVEKHREQLRDGRGAAWLGGVLLDLKLGLRMLVKYPGLTLVGVLGMSVAVTIGALAFTAVAAVTGTALPFDEGERVVTIQNFDIKKNDEGRSTHLHDMAVWREGLRTVDAISAYRTVDRNIVVAGRAPTTVRVAEMTASGFRLSRTAPALGRYLIDEDEKPGAPNVAVIGYDQWQAMFAGRADIVGSTLHIGTVIHTLVGVMPEGYAFPINNQLWTPLRLNPTDYPPGEAPSIDVFARLAQGATLGAAKRELAQIGQRLSATYPASHASIQPQVFSYTRRFLDNPGTAWLLHLAQVAVSLLLVVIGTNVAVLVYARTASRAGEMAVRTALGASRRRIVSQLFAEALVLSSAAAVVGLIVARFVFQRVEALVRQSADDQIPYWMRLEVTPATMLYVAGLAVLAAVIIGVIPGLKFTRDGIALSLKQHAGGSSMRLGGSWTALLVTQVAVSVAALPVTMSGGAHWVGLMLLDRGTLVTESLVMATPLFDGEGSATTNRNYSDTVRLASYTLRVDELIRRLEAEPGGFEIVRMSSPPGAESGFRFDIAQAASSPASDTSATRVGENAVIQHVGAGFFSALGITRIAGRDFVDADYLSPIPSLIVNRSFVTHFLGGGNALGRRLRRASAPPGGRRTNAETVPGPWGEIVGVVEDFPTALKPELVAPKLYAPLPAAGLYPVTLGVRARTFTGVSTADRIREAGMAVDPSIRFRSTHTLASLLRESVKVERLGMLGLLLVTLSVVLLSAAGIYALMSFTVARQRREIGIRVALGASPRRVLSGVLSRATRQVGIGVLIGSVGTGFVFKLAGDSAGAGEMALLVLQFAGMMAIVGLLATIGPARRALRVPPTEVMRAE